MIQQGLTELWGSVLKVFIIIAIAVQVIEISSRRVSFNSSYFGLIYGCQEEKRKVFKKFSG